jgi:hypothetical protein
MQDIDDPPEKSDIPKDDPPTEQRDIPKEIDLPPPSVPLHDPVKASRPDLL